MPDKRWLILAAAALVLVIIVSATMTDSPWDGIDATVVGKYATELGREPWTPLINVQGDLQLFVFTVAGIIGGFALGYHWRGIFGVVPGPAQKQTGGPGEDRSDVPGT